MRTVSKEIKHLQRFVSNSGGNEYFEHRWHCDPTQLGRFRKALGEEGVEELLARAMEVVVTLKLIARQELARVIVESAGIFSKVAARPALGLALRA